jgi:hydrogenase maturation protein HypF
MTESSTPHRINLSLQGVLQGIGFRPFVYKLAHEIGLKGWVQNSPQGVSIDVEGSSKALEEFLQRLQNDNPPNSNLYKLKSTYLEPSGYKEFCIRESKTSGDPSALILPDISTCSECLKELFDPSNRRYLYPFVNCIHCGPRFSIIESLPYDRQNTSMRQFQMCSACQYEYEDAGDRRFHAQPNACPDCGPRLEFWDTTGLKHMEGVLDKAVDALKSGAVIAVKGLGGFHLMVNACDDNAVRRLRERKHREEKPFALMFSNIESVNNSCELSSLEKNILLSPQAPIVLLRRKKESGKFYAEIAQQVAPSNPYLGVMLPSNPLHHILMSRFEFPIVATSGNVSDEIICKEEEDVLSRLGGIADCFIVHNRAISSHVDDSIVRVVSGVGQVLRRARGYAPLPITLKEKLPSLKGVGGYLKNTISITKENNIFISQHIGNLNTPQALGAFGDTVESMRKLYDSLSGPVVCDFHPDYPSTQWAQKNNESNIPVQHHVAHVFSCMAEHDLDGPLLGVSWDGSGYGLDGTIWGGEFFHIQPESIQRIACWKPFPLPGGDSAQNEPRRSALGLMYNIIGEAVFDQPRLLQSFSSDEIVILKTMLKNKINCPMTSSCGRLFDAVASLIGIRQINSFEGQAAMELEFLTQNFVSESFYDVDLIECQPEKLNPAKNIILPECYDLNLRYKLDGTSMIRQLMADFFNTTEHPLIATRFHNSLVESIVAIAKNIGEERVVLSGGCFQNKYLSEHTISRLRREGFRPYWHQRIPPNDGGLSLGQVFAASWIAKRKGVSDVFSDTR